MAGTNALFYGKKYQLASEHLEQPDSVASGSRGQLSIKQAARNS
jgi:hypothetical protein